MHAPDGLLGDVPPGTRGDQPAARLSCRERREGARPLGIFGDGKAQWVQNEEWIRGALTDKGSAYGWLGAPFVVAVESSSISLDDDDVRNGLCGTEVVEFRTFADGTKSTAMARETGRLLVQRRRWDHPWVPAILVVKNLHPGFVGTQQHTIWEHPDQRPPWTGYPSSADLSSRTGL